MNEKEELYTRLQRHKGEIRTVKVVWDASDGGPRMSVSLLDREGNLIDQWDDWMILGGAARPGSRVIDGIIENALGDHAIESAEFGSFYATFTIRG